MRFPTSTLLTPSYISVLDSPIPGFPIPCFKDSRFVPTCSNRPVASCFCQVCCKLVIRPATNLSTTNNFCPVTTSFNKPVVENVSMKRKIARNGHFRLHFLIQSLSLVAILNHIGETIVYSIYSLIKCKSRCFIFKK